MKKKRKKNISPFSPLICHSQLFPKADVALNRRSGSAPDVPTRSKTEANLCSCYEFAAKLFGKEEWQVESHCNTIHLRTFSRQLGEKTSAKWDTIQVGDRLYINAASDMSRNSFVALMDYAEEELEVGLVIVCLERSSQCFGELVKCFRFMGFEHLPPNHPAVPLQSCANGNLNSSFPKGFHYLGYEVD